MFKISISRETYRRHIIISFSITLPNIH